MHTKPIVDSWIIKNISKVICVFIKTNISDFFFDFLPTNLDKHTFPASSMFLSKDSTECRNQCLGKLFFILIILFGNIIVKSY